MKKTEGQTNGEQKATYVEGDAWSGLTKREYFAAKALQGLCAGRTEYEDPMVDANKAVELADLLLVALANER